MSSSDNKVVSRILLKTFLFLVYLFMKICTKNVLKTVLYCTENVKICTKIFFGLNKGIFLSLSLSLSKNPNIKEDDLIGPTLFYNTFLHINDVILPFLCPLALVV